MSHPDILTTIKSAEDKFGTASPFSTVAQMVALTRMASKNHARLSWLFSAIMDATVTGRLDRSDVSKRAILDKNRVSAADIMLYKYELHAELLGPVLSRLNFSAHVQNQLRVAFASHVSLRTAFGLPGMHNTYIFGFVFWVDGGGRLRLCGLWHAQASSARVRW